MDYTIVDISALGVGQIKVGDWVEFIGENINIKEKDCLLKGTTV